MRYKAWKVDLKGFFVSVGDMEYSVVLLLIACMLTLTNLDGEHRE